jgi:hypothetical protein
VFPFQISSKKHALWRRFSHCRLGPSKHCCKRDARYSPPMMWCSNPRLSMRPEQPSRCHPTHKRGRILEAIPCPIIESDRYHVRLLIFGEVPHPLFSITAVPRLFQYVLLYNNDLRAIIRTSEGSEFHSTQHCLTFGYGNGSSLGVMSVMSQFSRK